MLWDPETMAGDDLLCISHNMIMENEVIGTSGKNDFSVVKRACPPLITTCRASERVMNFIEMHKQLKSQQTCSTSQ